MVEDYAWHAINKGATNVPINSNIWMCHDAFATDDGNELPLPAFYKSREEANADLQKCHWGYYRHDWFLE